MINEFIQSYKSAKMTGGAQFKMNYKKLYSGFNVTTSEYDDIDISRFIQMHEGDSLSGFDSVDVFNYYVTPQLEKLKQPALELLQDTYDTLE